MKISEITRSRLDVIAQDYLGANPVDKHCVTWAQLQEKMIAEIEEALEREPQSDEELYYIQTGYVGNAILWWADNSNGYTAHFLKAGKYTKEETMKILNNGPNQDCGWLCSHVDNHVEAHVMTVESGFLNRDYQIKGEKK